MEENELYDRIGETDLNPTYKDGQTYQHTDINQMLGILKTAINENYYDIQRLLNGTKTVGNANQLEGATLSRYLDETLQADDNKVPSSQQAKAYMDELFAGYSAPVRGEDYWTDADKEEIIDDTATAVVEEITPSFEEALASKANINDIPTKVSDLANDSEFVTRSISNLTNYYNKDYIDEKINLNTSQTTSSGSSINIENVLNLKSLKIYSDTNQSGTPTTASPVDINFINGNLPITINGTTKTLSLGNIELCKLGNIKDYIYNLNGKWYLHKSTFSITLDGTEVYTRVASSSAYVTFVLTSYQSNVDGSIANNMLCNMLSAVSSGNPANTCRLAASGNIVLSFPAGFCNYDASSLKSKLATLYSNGTPLVLLLPLKTTTDTEITDKTLINQLNEILLTSINDDLSISISFGNLSPTLEVSVYKNTIAGQVTNNTDAIKDKIGININSNDTNSIDKTFKNFKIETDYFNNTLIYKITLNNVEEIKVLPTNGDLTEPGGANSLNVLDYSKNSDYALICNFGVFDTTTLELKGHAIFDGTTYSNPDPLSGNGYYYNGTDENNNLMSVLSTNISSVNDLVNLGFKNCSISWKPIFINGSVVTTSDTSIAPRQVLIQTYDNKYVILSTMGRDLFNKGLDMQDLATYIQENISNVKTALNVDGGGSVQTVYNKMPLFPQCDLSSINGRIISDVIVFKIKEVL